MMYFMKLLFIISLLIFHITAQAATQGEIYSTVSTATAVPYDKTAGILNKYFQALTLAMQSKVSVQVPPFGGFEPRERFTYQCLSPTSGLIGMCEGYRRVAIPSYIAQYGEIISYVSQQTGYSVAIVKAVLDAYHKEQIASMLHGDDTEISGFGTFKVSHHFFTQDNLPMVQLTAYFINVLGAKTSSWYPGTALSNLPAHAVTQLVGEKGATGDQGIPGADGIPGQKGDPGKDGAPGAQGAPGSPGAQGLPGKDGAPGATGAPGLPGKDGAPGLPGAPGRDGVDGKDGAPGAPGLPGRDGAAVVGGQICLDKNSRLKGGVIVYDVVACP